MVQSVNVQLPEKMAHIPSSAKTSVCRSPQQNDDDRAGGNLESAGQASLGTVTASLGRCTPGCSPSLAAPAAPPLKLNCQQT